MMPPALGMVITMETTLLMTNQTAAAHCQQQLVLTAMHQVFRVRGEKVDDGDQIRTLRV